LDQLSASLLLGQNRNKYSWLVIALLIAVKLKDSDIFNEYFKGSPYSLKIEDSHKIQKKLLILENKIVTFKVKPCFIEFWPSTDFNKVFTAKDNSRKKDMTTHDIISSYLRLKVHKFEEEQLIEIMKSFSQRSEINKLKAFDMIMYFCNVKQGATNDGYIDLVEMASDLK
jgi:hypothetical protein